jgi:hypothetical protein
VCCVFSVTSGIAAENGTYLKNVGFPSSWPGLTPTVEYTIYKISSGNNESMLPIISTL